MTFHSGSTRLVMGVQQPLPLLVTEPPGGGCGVSKVGEQHRCERTLSECRERAASSMVLEPTITGA